MKEFDEIGLFSFGMIVASIIWAICITDWTGTWECVEYKHTSITEGYCLVQRYKRSGEISEDDNK